MINQLIVHKKISPVKNLIKPYSPLLLLLLLSLVSCNQKQEKRDVENLVEDYQSLRTSVSDMKQYVRIMDSALFRLSVFENTLENPDSARAAIRSYDQDVVRMYKPEKTPVVDTTSTNYAELLKEANSVIEESENKVQVAREKMNGPLRQYATSDSLKMDPEVRENLKATISDLEETIQKVEKNAARLQNHLKELKQSQE